MERFEVVDDEIDSEVDEMIGNIEPPPAKRGRPPKKAAAKTVQRTTTVRTFDGDEEPEGDTTVADGMPFGGLLGHGASSDTTIVRVRITRTDPDEGMLGYLEDDDANEEAIKERWGGGVFKCQGVDARNRVRATATIRIAADPIFVSELAETKWRRAHNMPPKQLAGAAGAPQMSPQEIVAMVQAAEDKRRQDERERKEEERREQERIEEKRRADERAWQAQRERDAREWDEKRRKDDAEREDRKRREDMDREERRRTELREAEQRRQEHMQQMLLMVQKSSEQAMAFMKLSAQAPVASQQNSMVEAVKMIAVIKEAFSNEGSGEEDTMQTLLKNLPAMLNGAGSAIGGAIRELKGGGVPEMPPPSPIGLLPPGSPLTPKVEALAMKLMERGVDPEVAIGQIVDNINAQLDGGKPMASATQAPLPAPKPKRPVEEVAHPRGCQCPRCAPQAVAPQAVNGKHSRGPVRQTTTTSGAIRLAAPAVA